MCRAPGDHHVYQWLWYTSLVALESRTGREPAVAVRVWRRPPARARGLRSRIYPPPFDAELCVTTDR